MGLSTKVCMLQTAPHRPLPGTGQDEDNMQKSPLMGSLREKEGQHPILEVYYFHIS